MNSRYLIPLACALALGSTACSKTEPESVAEEPDTAAEENPFFQPSPLVFGAPQFDKIKDEHYSPAFERGFAEQIAEIEAIANNDAAPTFENTLKPLDVSGQTLTSVSNVFFNLVSANTNDTMEAVRSEVAPKFSAHTDAIFLNGDLFARVKAVYEQREDLGLDPESLRLLERNYKSFVRAGALLSDEDKEKLKAINTELAELSTTFSQNVLKEVNDLAVVVDTREELDGLSENAIAATTEAAKERELENKFVIVLRNTSGQPPMSSLHNRGLRERIHKISLSRGSRGGEFDNRALVARVMKLRAERAQMLGFEDHASFILDNQTAKTKQAVNDMLADLAPRAVANARREAADMQKIIDEEGGDFKVASWDWDYYTEKVRKVRYDFDESQLQPYFELDNVLQNGVFFAANRLYGLSFEERFDLPVYHPDVRVFNVYEANGDLLAIFYGDFFARSNKRGGAWMNAYVQQSGLMDQHPVVANHQNVTKPPEGEPALMTYTEVGTMFHEFGHALHGMFSDVNYLFFSGTSVPRDFVEYPSQVNAMWVDWPEVLENYAVHYETGEPMPRELLNKVLATSKFNQGFKTTEYLAASLLDQALHQLTPDQVPDAEGMLEFEAYALQAAGIAMDEIPPRYRTTYFSHIMGGYSAGYYSYIWSEVLDADSVEWFKENGGLKRENGDHFRATLLSRGGSEDAMKIFEDFRGAEPNIEPLLERRGLK